MVQLLIFIMIAIAGIVIIANTDHEGFAWEAGVNSRHSFNREIGNIAVEDRFDDARNFVFEASGLRAAIQSTEGEGRDKSPGAVLG